MTEEEFATLEALLENEVAARKKLGGYNTDAPTLEFLCSALLQLTRHVVAEASKSNRKR